jgi:predicted Rossmann fold flavoprotein
MRNILVIGGGASGMAAALFAARAGANVTLLERNEKLGKKVYITGKGRCNLTNDCALDDFLAEVPRNPRFLYSALSFLSPRDTMELMTENGCPVQVQRGQRVFPQSEKASDVTRALTHALDKAGVRIRLNAGIRSMEIRNGRVQSLLLDSGETLGADAVILCTGGYS